MMTVSSSISLHARAGFFCQKTGAAVLMREEPPKIPGPCGMTGYNRLFPLRPDLEFQEGAGWLPLPPRRKARSAGGCEASPSGGVLPLCFPPPARAEKSPPLRHWYSILPHETLPKKGPHTRAKSHLPGEAAKSHQ